MARNVILNLDETNWAQESKVGQANDAALQRTVTRPDGTIYTMPVALESCKFIGMKTDGLWYLASAEAGAGQVKCMAWNFDEAVNGQFISPMKKQLTLELGTAVSGALPGEVAYLSDTVPGHVVRVAPVGAGKIVQIVGEFISTTKIKVGIQVAATTL